MLIATKIRKNTIWFIWEDGDNSRWIVNVFADERPERYEVIENWCAKHGIERYSLFSTNRVYFQNIEDARLAYLRFKC